MCEYKENKFMSWLSFLVFLSTILATIFMGGCSLDRAITDNIQEEKFIHGCKAVHANANVGYLSQTGTIGVPCKVKCSKELPKGYCFKYEAKTPYGTCDIKAGECE